MSSGAAKRVGSGIAFVLSCLFLARSAPAQETKQPQETEQKPPEKTPVLTAPKWFLPAAGELILLEIGPWAFNRYVTKEDFAYISWKTVKANFRAGFGYDSDTFNVNQSSHPYHGSLFFAAARSNGYSYWESGAFALTGSFLWECCMENTRPSFNDLVNTTLGGMTRGEISHRIATALRDNTASGSERVWRELGGAFFDPVGALSRVLRGELGKEFPNPDDRFPSRFVVLGDLGYRRLGGSVANADQGVLTFSGYYGDPFKGEIVHPFDSFWVGIDLNQKGGSLVSRIEERGVLRGWELTDPDDPVRHIAGFSQEYEYFNNVSQVFGAQLFSGGLLSRYRIRDGVQAITDLSVLAVPLAGVQTTNFENPSTGRNYDYGPGGGARAEARLFIGGREVLAGGDGVIWTHTVNGFSENNTLQYARAVVRIPVLKAVSVGGAYARYSRRTTYPGFPEDRHTQSEWRVFLDFTIARQLGPRP